MQCACSTLSSLACPALQYFSTLSHKGHDFRRKKKKRLLKICVFRVSLQGLFEIFFILRRKERYMIKTVRWSSCRVALFLADYNDT